MNLMQTLRRVKAIDPEACSMGPGAPDCFLVAVEHAPAVLAAVPGSWEDPNDPPTSWTRIVVPYMTVEA